MDRLRNTFTATLFPFLLVILGVYLSYKNYTSSTFLTGWDALHPEFNFQLSFERMLSGVWRADQGLGALAAHAHMADFPRVIFLWLSSFLLPINFLRYFYVFITVVVGPLGMYLLIKETIDNKKNLSALFAAFLASVYYLLNLGTMQHFIVPFEMFNTQFAFMPLLFLFAWKFVQKGERKPLLIFVILSFIASPMAYASSLFFAYLGGLVLFLLTSWLLTKFNWSFLKRVVVVLLALFFTNLYWLAPNIYSIVNQGKTINTSKINQLFTPEAFLFNKSYGTLDNILINKNFLFSWKGYNFDTNEFVDLLLPWKNHLVNPGVSSIGYTLAALAILGIIVSFIRQHKFGIALLPTLLFSLFFLINENPPTEGLYAFLRTSAPIFGEGYRMAFTKFSLIYIFATAYFVGYFLYALFELGKSGGVLQKALVGSAKALFGFIVLMLNLYYMYPAFQGDFISKKVRLDIPQEYFQVYEKANQLDAKARIAKLPVNTPFNWEYHTWGLEGSGWFSWFFSPNPQLDRDFDRFSHLNESSYNELAFYLYQKDLDGFEKVLQKYNTALILLDESVVNPGADPKNLFVEETKDLLADEKRYEKVFTGEFLTLYSVKSVASGELSVLADPEFVDRNVEVTSRDLAYQNYGNYINTTNGLALPFSDIGGESGLKIEKSGNFLKLTRSLTSGLPQGELYIPDYFASEERMPLAIYASYNDEVFRLVLRVEPPSVEVDGQKYGGKSVEKVYLIPTNLHPKYVAIGADVFPLSNLTTSQTHIGNVFAQRDGQLRIGLYLDDGAVLSDLVAKLINNAPRSCSDATLKYAAEPVSDSGFTLSASETSTCQGESFDIVKESLVSIDFESSSISDVFPQLCVTGENYRKCLSEKIQEAYTGRQGTNRKFDFKLALSPGKYWLDFVSQARVGESVSIVYDNINIDAHPVNFIGLVPISRDFADLLVSEKVDVNHAISHISSIIPLVAPIKENLLVGRGHPSGFNCDVLDVGDSQKVVKDGSVVYVAKDGAASCDYYDYPQLFYDQGYLLNLQGVNRSGRGLKFYLFNKDSSRAELQELLPDGTFNEDYWVFPKTLTPGGGYTMNTEVRSFGRIPGESTINNISFYPIPLNWLSGVTITPRSRVEQASDIFLTNYSKLSNHFYKAGVSGYGGYVVLNQGYDAGWLGFDITKGWLSPRKLDHVKVNSWANGWLIANDDGETGKTRNIVLVFWPQYLEYFGFLVLIGGFSWIMFFVKDKEERLKKAIKD